MSHAHAHAQGAFENPYRPRPGDPPAPPPSRCFRCQVEIPPAPYRAASGALDWFPDYQCPKCKAEGEREAHEEKFRELLAGSNLPARYSGFTYRRISKLRPGEDVAALALRLEEAQAPTVGITPWNVAVATMLRDWRPGRRSVFLTGPVGGGKTTLVAAALVDLMWAGTTAVYLPEADLYARLRRIAAQPRERPANSFLGAGTSREVDILAVAKATPVLALDDLGAAERLEAWQRDAIEALVCARYDRALPMLITSNYDLRQIANLHGERVASRLSEMCRQQVQLTGYDWRTGHQHAAPKAAPPPRPPPELFRRQSGGASQPRDYKRDAAGDRDDED